MKIAIQGIEGSFHDEAVQRLFPNEEIELVKCESFDGVTQNVKKGKADYGVLAIENSIAGSILPNYNLVEAGDFEIGSWRVDTWTVDFIKTVNIL